MSTCCPKSPAPLPKDSPDASPEALSGTKPNAALTNLAPTPCCCGQNSMPSSPVPEASVNTFRYFGIGFGVFVLWCLLYMSVLPLAQWLTYEAFALSKETPLAAALEFFIYDTAKILLLLVFMVYVIAWLRATLNVERVRKYLAGKGRFVGYITGAGFGAITPFCSCSSIPLFLGFTTARIPIGITMSFLITSPLINEVAVIVLWGLLGWKFTLIYVGTGLLAGIVGGIVMDILKAERWLQPFVLESMKHRPLQRITAAGAATPTSAGLMLRHRFAWSETTSITRKVWLWVIAGVGLGATLHGFVPQAWFETYLSAGQWWSVPLAVAVGIPLYTNVTGIIPIMESLLLKGLPVGTTLAFCMSTVAASLPEVLMLKQVMRWRLLALFLGTLLVIFTLVGWFFNATQGYFF